MSQRAETNTGIRVWRIARLLPRDRRGGQWRIGRCERNNELNDGRLALFHVHRLTKEAGRFMPGDEGVTPWGNSVHLEMSLVIGSCAPLVRRHEDDGGHIRVEMTVHQNYTR